MTGENFRSHRIQIQAHYGCDWRTAMTYSLIGVHSKEFSFICQTDSCYFKS